MSEQPVKKITRQHSLGWVLCWLVVFPPVAAWIVLRVIFGSDTVAK